MLPYTLRSAVKEAQLLWHYCAVQIQGFSISVTAWQTQSNPQSLSLLILSDKGAHKARVGCFVPSIPGQYLSFQTQSCQLTSPGLMSLRALSCSRKLLSGKDASALGMQLWLPAGFKQATREVFRWPLHRWNRVFEMKWQRPKRGHHLHLHELWSRKSPEPSQFRKSPVSTERNKQFQPLLQSNHRLHDKNVISSALKHRHNMTNAGQQRDKFTTNNTATLR